LPPFTCLLACFSRFAVDYRFSDHQRLPSAAAELALRCRTERPDSRATPGMPPLPSTACGKPSYATPYGAEPLRADVEAVVCLMRSAASRELASVRSIRHRCAEPRPYLFAASICFRAADYFSPKKR